MDIASLSAALKDGTITIGDAITRANEIRLRLDAEEQAFKDKMKRPKEYLGSLSNLIHEWLNANGLQNMKGVDGSLAFKAKKVSVSVADWAVVWADMVANNRYHFLNHAVNKTEVTAYVEETGSPPPGVNYTVTEELQFRQPRKRNGSQDTESTET